MNKGIESLQNSVKTDCERDGGRFSADGCTKGKGCRYCGKYKWVMDRAAHYSERTGQTIEEILIAWETGRDYWYMNYYKESHQPLLDAENTFLYEDWLSELTRRFGDDAKLWAFKCPSCGNVQTGQDFIDNGAGEHKDQVYFNCIGRHVKGKGCDWSLGGLLRINKVSVLQGCTVFPVFEMAEVAK